MILALIEHKNLLMVFEKNFNLPYNWRLHTIKGEACTPLDQTDWTSVLQQVSDALNKSTGLAGIPIYFACSSQQERLLSLLQTPPKDQNMTVWHCLHIEKIKRKEPFIDAQQQEAFIRAEILPALDSIHLSLYPADQQATVQAIDKKEEYIKQLNQEKQTLIQKENCLLNELETLKRKLENQVKKVDLSLLVTFLPILYKNFWGQIRPDELALLAGTLEIPPVPSPIQEPDQGVIQVMKKKLIQLPEEKKQELRLLCAQLPHQPQPRPEMAFFFEADH